MSHPYFPYLPVDVREDILNNLSVHDLVKGATSILGEKEATEYMNRRLNDMKAGAIAFIYLFGMEADGIRAYFSDNIVMKISHYNVTNRAAPFWIDFDSFLKT